MTKPDDTRPPLTSRLNDAFVFAARLHRNQTRKGTPIPYMSHLMSVAALVLEDGGTEDEAIAALLHDAVEDHGGPRTREKRLILFGGHLVEIVNGCTDSDTIPRPPWRERRERYLAHLREATPSVLRVSLADKLHNARAILADLRQDADKLWSRFNASKDDQLWYYRSLADLFREKHPGWMAEELDRVVTVIESSC